MSSILDHVEQSVPRATVYGAMKGSPVFIGKYFRKISPSSNATTYNYRGGERKITFIIASPDKTIFHDLRSTYIKLKIKTIEDTAGAKVAALARVSEPATNLIERIVIKMNGTVVEDISRFDYLTSFFKKSLLKRNEKNAREREGWDYVVSANGQHVSANSSGETSATSIVESGAAGSTVTLKLDMSGIMNVQQLLSGYYSPLEIELFLQDPAISCQADKSNNVTNDAELKNAKVNEIIIENPRLCIDQVVMSPEYVSAFESALLSNSNAQGIQIPFSTYYTYSTDVKNTATTFWIRKPVRYLRSVFWGATSPTPDICCNYKYYRVTPDPKTGNSAVGSGVSTLGGSTILVKDSDDTIDRWQVAIGTKSYREIEEKPGDSDPQGYYESQIMFSKAVGHYNDYSTESDEYTAAQRALNLQVQGIDLEYSPDNDVLASETTLNSNDIRLTIEKSSSTASHRIMVFLNYQASIALFPGNETRLLIT